MMRRSVVYPIFILAALGAASTNVRAQGGDVAVTNLEGQTRFSSDQIDNLTGPVALYPDALLAQVLVASTFPDQVADAAAYVRANGTSSIDNQNWDISVKAVAHYPSALNAMADKIDWTTALGQAYASQSSEVMQSVQRLRSMASANGNLNTTAQQQVIRQGTTYEIVPVEPRVIYVPVYDPYVIYSRPIFNVGYTSRFWSFGVGFPIGAWLSYDCDWGTQRVYYNGWSPTYYSYSGNWRLRSQPYIRVTDIYVSPRYRTVYVNRNVVTHVVDYRNVDRYQSVHGGSHFEGRYDNRYDGRRDGNITAQVRSAQAQNGGGYRVAPRDNNGRGANSNVNAGSNGNRDVNRNGDNRNGDNRNGDNHNANNGRGTQPANGDMRTAVPQQRRNEPSQRTDGQSPQLMTPQRGQVQGQPGQIQPQQRQAEPRQPQPSQVQAQPQQPQQHPQRSEPQQRIAPAAAAHPKPADDHRGRGEDHQGRGDDRGDGRGRGH